MKYLLIQSWKDLGGAERQAINLAKHINAILYPTEGYVLVDGKSTSDEANILRYVSMGDTVYDVAIPDDALVFSYTTPEINKPCFITNKIIIGRPRKLTDKVCIELYKTSDLPLESYYQILPHLVHCNLKETAQLIIKEKVKENTYDCVSEITKFFNK